MTFYKKEKKEEKKLDKWMMISYWFELQILNLNTMIMKITITLSLIQSSD